MDKKTKRVAIIVAHPDDETLWAGGTILSNPEWRCFVVCLCRKNDADRAPKFAKALNALGAHGIMGDLDDGPTQSPLNIDEVENAILQLLPSGHFDLVITHSNKGEYTRHRRHEETGTAVINLWNKGKLDTTKVWAFAYEDHNRDYFPVSIEDAPVFNSLPHPVWEQKYHIINDIYGFDKHSWEAQATPKEEAFWQFFNANQAHQFLESGDYAA
jgi:LmbE family N-acetylglucosaminyl deacetylase